MHYREILPPPALATRVRCFWFLDARAPPGTVSGVESIVPDGSPELIVHLGEPFARITRDGEARQPRALLVGQIARPFLVRPSRAARVAAVRFAPDGLAAFVGFPVHQITQAELPAEDAWPGRVASLLEALDAAADDASRAALLSAFLLHRAAEADRGADRRVRAAIALLDRGTRVAQAAHACGVTPRQLERLFRDRVGLSPRRLARIRRVQAALLLMRAPGPRGLAEVAHAVGCSDQAHLCREFREIAGASPGTLASGASPLVEALAG